MVNRFDAMNVVERVEKVRAAETPPGVGAEGAAETSPGGVILDLVRDILARRDSRAAEPGLDCSLTGDGLGLDSLEVAEIIVALDDRYGKDPITAERFDALGSLRALIDFYEHA